MLPLGSIVLLKGGEKKVMITARFPLYNNNGTIGYFDYGSCIYPIGQTDQQVFFFNEEDIQEIFFKGYTDHEEEDFARMAEAAIMDIPYPRLKLDKEDN